MASRCAPASCRAKDMAFLQLVTALTVAQFLFFFGLAHRCRPGRPATGPGSGGSDAQELSPEVSGIPRIHCIRCVAWTDTSYKHNVRTKSAPQQPQPQTQTTKQPNNQTTSANWEHHELALVQARGPGKVWEKPSQLRWPGQHLLPLKPAQDGGGGRPSPRSHTSRGVGSCSGQLERVKDDSVGENQQPTNQPTNQRTNQPATPPTPHQPHQPQSQQPQLTFLPFSRTFFALCPVGRRVPALRGLFGELSMVHNSELSGRRGRWESDFQVFCHM